MTSVDGRLRRLGDENFGDRLARARTTSRVGLRGAAELISSSVMPVSFVTLSRLERLPTPPSDVRKRMMATLAVLAYGYEPDDFGLSIDDLPRSIDVDRFIARARAVRDGDDDGDGDSGSDGGGPPRGGPPSPQTPRINGLCAPVTQRTAA